MINPFFKRFLDEVIIPAQAGLPETVKKTQAPDGISEEAKLFLDIDKGPTPPINIQDAAQRSAVRQMMGALWHSAEKYLDIEVDSRIEIIAGVQCKIFTPKHLKNCNQKLLYLHGGAYWLGSAEVNSSIAINMADKTGLEVISVDYRLAPEHPFPAAQQDVLAVYEALLASGQNPAQMVIFGDSAGGGLALSAATEIRNQNLPKPAALGLIAPWADLSMSGDSHKTHNLTLDTRLSVEGLKPAAKAYAHNLPLDHAGVSPLFASMESLPPILIQVGSRELLLSDSTRLAQKATDAGVHVTLNVYEAMWHVWQFYPHLPEGDKAIQEMADFLCGYMT